MSISEEPRSKLRGVLAAKEALHAIFSGIGDVFDSVSVEKNAPAGTYDFLVEKGDYVLLYTNKHRMIEKHDYIRCGLYLLGYNIIIYVP